MPKSMRDEFDFSDAGQGQFYRPLEDLDIPVYLDHEVRLFFVEKIRGNSARFSLSEVVNALLKKEMEILRKLTN